MLDLGGRRCLECLDPTELASQGQATELGAQMFGGDDDQALQLVDRLGPTDQDGGAGGQDHPQRLAQSPGPGQSLELTGERRASGARTASRRSFLAPRARLPAPTSARVSPASARVCANPAAKLPVPSSAEAFWPSRRILG